VGAEVVIRTQEATDWPEKEPVSVKLWRTVLFFVPRANPDYDKKMHLLHEWWIEFDEAGNPGREIGLDARGKPVLAGPDDRNYGFWLDTNMTLKDFDHDEVPLKSFEALWNQFFNSGIP
jgi:hypothetical protein